MKLVLCSALLALGLGAASPEGELQAPARPIQGMTISTARMGQEWGTAAFDRELDRLQALGVNWVAIHPYARIGANGSVRSRGLDGDTPPAWITRPIRAAHERGMQILIKPHLAYWGSPFAWRGSIAFDDPAATERFWTEFTRWTVQLATAAQGADGFCVGTELEAMVEDDAPWRKLIAKVRAATDAHLTYAANWDGVHRVSFWDALDAIGVQAYFPLKAPAQADGLPSAQDLRAAWQPHIAKLRALSQKLDKPVVFAELGYDAIITAHERPWEGAPRHLRHIEPSSAAKQLQLRCLQVAFEVIESESDWLHGAFLWKWFVQGSNHHGSDFRLDGPATRRFLTEQWAPPGQAATTKPD